MVEKIYVALSYLICAVFILGWIDLLWIFGVENSQRYTWWAVIFRMGQ